MPGTHARNVPASGVLSHTHGSKPEPSARQLCAPVAPLGHVQACDSPGAHTPGMGMGMLASVPSGTGAVPPSVVGMEGSQEQSP